MHDRTQKLTLLIALIGALAWTPTVCEYMKPHNILGKVISRYYNLNKDYTKTFFLYKLSVLSENRSFNIKEIKCEIEDIKGNKFIDNARNMRFIVFTHQDGKRYKLNITGDCMLNNYSIFLANQNIEGYLFFSFDGNLDRELRSTKFIFKSYNNSVKELYFDESEILDDQLFFDDTIWEEIDLNSYMEKHPDLQK